MPMLKSTIYTVSIISDDILIGDIYHFFFIVLAVTKRNSNVMMILVFLHRLIHVFQEYFKEVLEESIRDNFVIIYELLDEMMDFGYPQISETKILQE
jgi:AP-1 complex subunit mu